jgi:hypothetical protein
MTGDKTVPNQRTKDFVDNSLGEATLGIQPEPHPGVRINRASLAAFARALAEIDNGGQPTHWDDALFWPTEADPATRIQLIAVGNSINFRFWRRSNGRTVSLGGEIDGQRFSGSLYLWRRLASRFRDKEFPVADANFWASITLSDFSLLFSDDAGKCPLTEGVDDRLENLHDFGSRLKRYWSGSFAQLCSASEASLQTFLDLSGEFRAFDDPLRKLALVNAIMLKGSGLVEFREPLLPAIDYQLMKQILRVGAIEPDVRLQKKLSGGEYLEPDESLALRRATFSALVKISELTEISGDRLDNLLWFNRTNCTDEKPKCDACPFQAACLKRTAMGRPLEITRYY